jgi:hypothetical protein
MTILATEAHPKEIVSGGVGPLTWVAGEAHDAFGRTLAKGAASGSQRVRPEDLERCAELVTAIGPRMDASEITKPIAGKDEVVPVA